MEGMIVTDEPETLKLLFAVPHRKILTYKPLRLYATFAFSSPNYPLLLFWVSGSVVPYTNDKQLVHNHRHSLCKFYNIMVPWYFFYPTSVSVLSV